MNYTGNDLICKTLATASPSTKLWTADVSDTLKTMILRTVKDLSSPDKTTMIAAIEAINQSMTFSMHPIGHYFTVGDFTLWAAIRNSPAILAEVQVKDKYPELQLWYEDYMEKQPVIQQVFKAMNTMTKEPAVLPPPTPSFNVLSVRNPNQPRLLASSSKAPNNARLSSASLLRYVPSDPCLLISQPSGYLHIGHAKAAILNATAAKDYEGKFICRFDDTNPSKEKLEFEEAQLKDLHTIGCIPDTVSHTSDYFDQIEKKCFELIEMGKAYCDNTPMDIVCLLFI